MRYLKSIPDEIKDILIKAKQAQGKAFAPYSKFKVGVALLTDDNNVYTGCNIENASYSLTICAERVAIFKAISEGATNIKLIAIIGQTEEPISPCGACRQVMAELASGAKVILSNFDMTKVIETDVEELLPYRFDL